MTLYRSCGLEPDWILFGQEPASKGSAVSTGVRETASDYATAPTRATVYAMARTDSETGAWVRQGLENIPVFEALVRPNLLVVKMDNTAMEPVIRRGAYVGIDCDDVRIRSGEIYALDFPGEGLVIKRVVRDLEAKRLTILADNPAHQPQHLPLDTPDVTPLGKAVWVIQEL